MSRNERIFGDVVLGIILGAILWASLGNLFGMLFKDNLYMVGHTGGRGSADAYVDSSY